MAGVRTLDQKEWDKQSAHVLPKPYGNNKPGAWLLGDVNKPWPSMRNKSASRKVSSRERGTYEACRDAFAAGRIWSWSIDDKRSTWLVKVDEGSDWLELDMAGVGELVGMGSAPKVVKPAKSTEPVQVRVNRRIAAKVQFSDEERASMAKYAAAMVEEVRVSEVQIAGLPAEVEEYLSRLVFAEKKAYATELAAALVAGGPVPVDPGTEWSAKVQSKLARLVRS